MQAQAGVGWPGLGRQAFGAGANGKHFLHQFNRQIDNATTAERAEVARPVGCHFSRGIDAREWMLDIDLDKGVEFVVSQLHIIGGLQLLDELRFDQQRFQFGAKHARLDLFDVLQEPIHFARVAKWLAVVGCKSIFQALSLTNIDHLPINILHQVHAWQRRKITLPRRIQE